MQQDKGQYNVGGVLLPRPFKIRRLGHFGFKLSRLEEGLRFYTQLLGFRVTDELDLSRLPGVPPALARLQDPRVVFTSHGSDHHSLLLAPKSLGSMMGDDAGFPDITVNQITWQVGTLEEVVNAYQFLKERGIKIRRVGRDMPGRNWHVYFCDPDGHTIELYYGIEQVGWTRHSRWRCTIVALTRRLHCRRCQRQWRSRMPCKKELLLPPATVPRKICRIRTMWEEYSCRVRLRLPALGR